MKKRTPARTAPEYRCSFCGQDQKNVHRLIAGPGGVYICDVCNARFTQMIEVGEVPGDPTGFDACSFCGKRKVKAFASDKAAICADCIGLVDQIVQEEAECRVSHRRPPEEEIDITGATRDLARELAAEFAAHPEAFTSAETLEPIARRLLEELLVGVDRR